MPRLRHQPNWPENEAIKTIGIAALTASFWFWFCIAAAYQAHTATHSISKAAGRTGRLFYCSVVRQIL